MNGRTAGKIRVDGGLVERYTVQVDGGQRDGRTGGGVEKESNVRQVQARWQVVGDGDPREF